MKILQVVPDMHSGGVEVETLIIARGIRDAGHKSLVAAASNKMLATEQGIGFLKLNLKTKNPFGMVLNGFRLARLAKKENVSLFHVRSRAPAWSVVIASKLTGIPFIGTWHSAFGIDRFGIKKIYNAVMAKGRYVISISNFITDYILKNYRIDEKKIIQISRGVDVNLLTPKYHPAIDRAALNLPDEVRLMGSIGRISSNMKGFDVLIAALPYLPKDIHLAIIGSDPKDKKADLIAQATALDVAKRLHFVEHMAAVQDFIALCDIGVSGVIKGEAFGRTAVEFQAMGKPFFGSDLGAFRENVFYGGLFPAKQPEELAKRILSFLAEEHALDETARATHRNAAYEFVQKNYNQDVMIARTLALYERVLQESAPDAIQE